MQKNALQAAYVLAAASQMLLAGQVKDVVLKLLAMRGE